MSDTTTTAPAPVAAAPATSTNETNAIADAILADWRTENKTEAPEAKPALTASDTSAIDKAIAATEPVVTDPVTEAETETEALPEGVTFDEATGRYRDASGKFVAKDGTPEVAEEAAHEVVTEEPKRTPATQFAVLEGDAEVEIPDNLQIRFTYKGEERVEPLDKVVRLAQNGAYNHEVAQQVKQIPQLQQQIQQEQQTRQQVEAAMRERDQIIESLLSDENYLYATREAWMRENTPEAQLQREREQLQQERQSWAQEQTQRQVEAFASTVVLPTFEALTTQYPSVTAEEAYGRFSLLTAPMLVGGVVPPTRFAEVQSILTHDLPAWMAEVNESRASATRQQTEAAQAKVKQAQLQTVKARKQLTRSVRPVANTTPTSAGNARIADRTPTLPPPKTLDDAIDRALSKHLSTTNTAA